MMFYNLRGGVGIPSVHYFDGKTLVTDRLGSDLGTLPKERKRLSYLETVILLVDQLIALVQYIHTHGIVHRGIRPDRFAMGFGPRENQVHVVEFSLAKLYCNLESQLHEAYGENEFCPCSIPYMSIRAHEVEDVKQSRRDDLESLGYVFFYLLFGSLPWDNKEDDETKKMKQSIEKLCPNDVPVEFFTYFEYVHSLEFDEEPDYSYLRNIFRRLSERKSYHHLFNWVKAPPLAEVLGDIESLSSSQMNILTNLRMFSGTIPWRSVVDDVILPLNMYYTLLRWNHPTASDEVSKQRSDVLSMCGLIEKLLDLMWKNQNSSIYHMQGFARTAYGYLTVASDYAPQFRAIWYECLGNVSLYSMMAKDDYAPIASYWYRKAFDLNPKDGHLQRRLGVSCWPDVLQQLFFYFNSLTNAPTDEIYERLMLLFKSLPEVEINYPGDHRALIVFAEAHGLLFRRQEDSLFIQHASGFLNQLDRFAVTSGKAFCEQGVYIVASNYAAIMMYGRDKEALLKFAFATLSIILAMKDLQAALPSVHVSLAFLLCLATTATETMDQIQTHVPWKRLAGYLNMLVTPHIPMFTIENAEFPQDNFGSAGQLVEDILIYSSSWCQLYYPQGFFDDLGEDLEPQVDLLHVNYSRTIRCLCAGMMLARVYISLSLSI